MVYAILCKKKIGFAFKSRFMLKEEAFLVYVDSQFSIFVFGTWEKALQTWKIVLFKIIVRFDREFQHKARSKIMIFDKLI